MYPKTFFDTNKIQPQLGTCFVIMPFAGKFDTIYSRVKQAVEGKDLGFGCMRADDLLRSGHIIEDILRGISGSEIVVADVTDQNPNVFYELGIAHMMKEVDKVILLSQDPETIPFDLRSLRHIIYKSSKKGLEVLGRQLVGAICAVSDRVHRFEVEGGHGELKYRLMGQDNYHYGFRVSSCSLGYNSAKLQLVMTRYAIGRPPMIVSTSEFGLQIGRRRPIPGTEWLLSLEKCTAEVAILTISGASGEKEVAHTGRKAVRTTSPRKHSRLA